MGSKWENAELEKISREQHPIIQWFKALRALQEANPPEKKGGRRMILTTGPAAAYLALAYELYLLDHNGVRHRKLVQRLKKGNLFQGAKYELFVIASFLKAGFEIQLQDEQDGSTSHCEFDCTFKANGEKFTVEAKSRHRAGVLGRPGESEPVEQIKLHIDGLLSDALAKRADYTRIIFIDVNVPPTDFDTFKDRYWAELADMLDRKEQELVDGQPNPPAYVFATNYPYHWVGEDELSPEPFSIFTGFNMPDFKDIEAGGIDPIKHQAVIALNKSLQKHGNVPAHFLLAQ